MIGKKRHPETGKNWFLGDRPIRDAGDDRLGSASLAKTVVEAVASAEPPCMIGLLGGFGAGKSSVAALASSHPDLARSFDCVTVSADKHSGNERARNLVHAIAAELQKLPKIDSAEVGELLRPLRQSTQVTALDPTDTAWSRMRSGRYSFKEWLASLLPPLFIAAVISVLALLLFDGTARTGVSAFAVAAVPVWLLMMLASDWAAAVKGLGAGAELTDQMPRAEAADEIEEVFGDLVDLHQKKRRDRRLVIFVDDIDRLSRDDLLDALRSLRSLQSVPRGAEPVFVISCDEEILRSAVRDSLNRPATATDHGSAEREAAENGREGGGIGQEARGGKGGGSEHDHPALAFVDKLLTARVQMPPAMGGDMRRFAERAIAEDHPLRAESGVDLDLIVAILIHDGVSTPRSAIRLLNRFIAAYLLAKERESTGDVAFGDITDHVDALAQLCVLLDEYPQFYKEIADNTVLLTAAHKVALRRRNLAPSEIAALKDSDEFRVAADDAGGVSYEFVCAALRRFISGTAHRVSLPADVGPLVYFMDTPGGRVLGAQLRSAISSAVQSGDPEDLGRVLGEVPDDQIAAAAGEIQDKLRNAAPVDANTYVSAVAANLHRLQASASSVGDACADLLGLSSDAAVSAPALTAIIGHTGPGRHDFLCGLLIRHDDAEEATSVNDRIVHAAVYMGGNPQIRQLVEPSVADWVESLPEAGDWELARPWLEPTESLDPSHYGELRSQIASSLVQCVRSERGFNNDDADRLVHVAETAIAGVPSAAPDPDVLPDEGPHTRSAFVRLWDITDHEGSASSALLSARAAADDGVHLEVRELAIRQTAAWTDEWTDAEWEEAEEAGDGEVHEVIVASLVEVVGEPALLAEVARVLPGLATAIEWQAEPLISAVAEAALELATEDLSAAEEAAKALFHAAEATDGSEHEGMADEHARRMLDAIDSDRDPSDPLIHLSLSLIPTATATEAGRRILGPRIRQWANGIGGADAFHQARIEGLKAVSDLDRQLIAEHAQAQELLNRIRDYMNSTDQRREPLRTLAAFPWPDPQVEPALTTIKDSWGQMPPGTRLPALQLVRQASDEFQHLAWAHNRIANDVESEPSGEASKIAAAETHRMRPDIKARVFASAVGKHEEVTAEWANLDPDTAAEVIVDRRGSEDTTLTRLFDSMPSEHRSPAAAEALNAMAETSDAPEVAVQAAARYCDRRELAEAARTATEVLAENGTVTGALRVVAAARDNQAEVDTAPIQEQAASHLEDATVETAALYGRAIGGDRQTTDLKNALRELRRGDSHAKSVAAAFDSEARS